MPTTPPTGGGEISDDDQIAFRHPSRSGQTGAAVGLLLLFVVAYAVSLTSTAPARLIGRLTTLPPTLTGLSGTIWNGSALLAGTLAIRWEIAPVRSVLRGSLVGDWSLRGSDTSLQGRAALRSRHIVLEDVDGRAGWTLVSAISPTLAISCDATARVSIRKLAFGDDEKIVIGEVQSAPGTCVSLTGVPPEPVGAPPLIATAIQDGGVSRFRVTTAADPGTILTDASLTKDGDFSLTVYPAGARLVPGMPTSGATTIELRL